MVFFFITCAVKPMVLTMEKKAAFEQDRIKVAEQNYEDHYLTTDMETMERLL